jgi:transcriptional regulator with XRE-family HTH domain
MVREVAKQPKGILSQNLRALMQRAGMKGPEVAAKAHVDRKTINNMEEGRFDPRPEMVVKVAKVFGYGAHQLLDPNFNPDTADSPELRELIASYNMADPDGRDNILRIAKMAAGNSR